MEYRLLLCVIKTGKKGYYMIYQYSSVQIFCLVGLMLLMWWPCQVCMLRM